MKERKISEPAMFPVIFMGEEYPAHFRFYERNEPPVEGEEIGFVYDFIPTNNDMAKHLPETRLVWRSGCVNQVSITS